MQAPERLSIRARLRISIVGLVTAVVIALTALHLDGVVDATFADAGERARMLADQVSAYLLESVNRRVASERPGSLADSKAVWYEAVRTDPSLTALLQRTLARGSAVIDVAVLDDQQRVLAAADASRVGHVVAETRSWDQWQSQDFLWRLIDLFRNSHDLDLETPIGIPGVVQPVMQVRVSLSPVLLRKRVGPKLEDLAVFSFMSLALSVLLAIIVSRLFGDSLEQLGQRIDLIAQGDLKAIRNERFLSPEMIDIESKLWWLGRQYTGAKSDILHLRSNVEQMLRRLDEAILIFGPDGRLQMAGEAAQRLLARPREELLGRSAADLFPGWTGLGAVLHNAIASRQPVREQQVMFDRPNLTPTRLLVSVEPIEYDDGGATGILVAMRDAETRLQIQSDLDTARRVAAIGRITSGVAHEIKNPLNAMMLHLEIAQEKGRSGEDNAVEIAVVKSELLRLDRVVKAFLDFNRPIDIQMVECDLNQMAGEVASLIKPQADAQSLRIELKSEVEHAIVFADQDLLKQALLNVVTNALESMSSGGEMCIHIEQRDREYVVVVKDQGCGIPPDIRDKIFNLYFTTKRSGTGVGLAMTYRIMQLHNGMITVESEVGKGSTFRLSLPAGQPREVAA